MTEATVKEKVSEREWKRRLDEAKKSTEFFRAEFRQAERANGDLKRTLESLVHSLSILAKRLGAANAT